MSESLFDRYLQILGVNRESPGLKALSRLTRAHLKRVPFENISKLYHHRRSPLRSVLPLERFLEGIEKYNLGGTCYNNNYHLYRLLQSLGYRIKLCSADISVEKAAPDSHMVSIVSLEEGEFIVDVGYAAPFWEPMPCFLAKDYVIELGYEKYILKPRQTDGRQHLELYRHGERKHGYLVKPEPRELRYFDEVIAGSFAEQAPFMNAVALVRFHDNGSTIIRNLTLTQFSGRDFRTEMLADAGALIEAIADRFGIPAEISAEALSQLRQFRALWG
ncbi:MAG: arylamine N-acetyltransferase [Candidatus Zixiibacteriota bacterium]